MAKNKTKALQIFSDESLEYGRKLSADDVALFLENFRLLHAKEVTSKSKLISLKVSEPLLLAFKLKAESQGLKYQTQIKILMEKWLTD